MNGMFIALFLPCWGNCRAWMILSRDNLYPSTPPEERERRGKGDGEGEGDGDGEGEGEKEEREREREREKVGQKWLLPPRTR